MAKSVSVAYPVCTMLASFANPHKPGVAGHAIFPALGMWRLKDQKFKVVLLRVILRSTWAI